MMSELPALDLSVRVGCELEYETEVATPILVAFKPRQDLFQKIVQESMRFEPHLHATEFEDDHFNINYRLNLKPGRNLLRYDAIVSVPSARESFMQTGEASPSHLLPPQILRYTLPSRYVDSDKLLDFAWQHFGHLETGLDRVLGICDWLHKNIEYRLYSGNSELSAHDIIQRGYGVCRDFAHMALALCRTFNLPARYVSGFVPDIGNQDPGRPMDFHAYIEVYLGGQWRVFDARFNTPRIGRVRICAGYDAVNCAFSTVYGAARLSQIAIWAYQVDPEQVRVGDPVDLSRRLCGTPEVRRPVQSVSAYTF